MSSEIGPGGVPLIAKLCRGKILSWETRDKADYIELGSRARRRPINQDYVAASWCAKSEIRLICSISSDENGAFLMIRLPVIFG